MDFQTRLFILLKENKNPIVKRQHMKKDWSIAFSVSIPICLKSLWKRKDGYLLVSGYSLRLFVRMHRHTVQMNIPMHWSQRTSAAAKLLTSQVLLKGIVPQYTLKSSYHIIKNNTQQKQERLGAERKGWSVNMLVSNVSQKTSQYYFHFLVAVYCQDKTC